MGLDTFKVGTGLATTLAIAIALGAAPGAAMAQVSRLPTRPILPPSSGAPAQPQSGAPSGVPTGLVTACATFDYQGADGARNMGMRVLSTGQQFVLQPEGNGVVAHADYPSPNIPSSNAAGVFDALRAAWTARRSVTLGISPQGQLQAVNLQLGGVQQC